MRKKNVRFIHMYGGRKFVISAVIARFYVFYAGYMNNILGVGKRTDRQTDRLIDGLCTLIYA